MASYLILIYEDEALWAGADRATGQRRGDQRRERAPTHRLGDLDPQGALG
jgi:hypothetical protein